MFDPLQVLSQILENITSKAQPLRPQLPSLFDYFLDNRSVDLIEPIVIKKWTKRMNNESSRTNEGFYSIPASFYNQVAGEVFRSLSDADLSEIQQAHKRAHRDAVIEYKNKMKILYKVESSTDNKGYGALETVADVLQPIMAALEALTDLHMIGWAGGSANTDIGIIKISGQCSDLTESRMIFPRSQADRFRHAALEWMAEVTEQWVGNPSMEQGIARIVHKRKGLGDDMRVIKRTRTVDHTNTHNTESSSLFLQSRRPKITRSSLNTALHASSFEGQMTGFQDVTVGQAHMPGSSDFVKPTKTPQKAVLSSRGLGGCQTLNAYDKGSTAYTSQAGSASASEGVRILWKQKNSTNVTAGDDSEDRYYRPLIATIPTSAKNLRHGSDAVIKVDLGHSFRDVVTLLIDIETLYGFTSPTRGLPRRLRPSEVSRWIKRGRGRGGGQVIVVDIEEFSKAWWKWWTDMQPKWREHDAHDKPKQVMPVRAEDEDWTCLQKPGANGMINVVAGLHGWGVAIKKQIPSESGRRKADWLYAVEDCRWVMERLLEYLKIRQNEWSKGHQSEDEPEIETVYDDIDYMQGESFYRP
ncbi:hypothetical protein E4T56_gene16353 [Termitomyces sp. T112]|nr:hypothetical protein E4T56_gene16353 [Termitomyces sp. T112]